MPLSDSSRARASPRCRGARQHDNEEGLAFKEDMDMAWFRHLVCLAAVVLAWTVSGCSKSHPDCCECTYSGSACSGSASIRGSIDYATCQEACQAEEQDMSCPLQSARECKGSESGAGPDASAPSRRDSAVPSGPDSSRNAVCCATPSIGYCNCYDNKTCDSDDVRVSSCPSYAHCCQDIDITDFCTCWDLTCSETAGLSYEVPGCP